MTVAALSWKEQVKSAWPYATATTALMFAACAVVGMLVSWQTGARGTLSYILAAADPAVASLVMLSLGLFWPALYAGRHFRVPHTLTLPTVFMAIVFAMKSIGQSSSSAIQGIEGAQRFDLLWLDGRIVAEAWVALVLVLTGVGLLSRGQSPQAS